MARSHADVAVRFFGCFLAFLAPIKIDSSQAYASKALLQREVALRAEHKRLASLAEESQKCRDDLIQKDQLLCSLVGIATHDLCADYGNVDKLPSEAHLSALRAHVMRAAETLSERQKQFVMLQVPKSNAWHYNLNACRQKSKMR